MRPRDLGGPSGSNAGARVIPERRGKVGYLLFEWFESQHAMEGRLRQQDLVNACDVVDQVRDAVGDQINGIGGPVSEQVLADFSGRIRP